MISRGLPYLCAYGKLAVDGVHKTVTKTHNTLNSHPQLSQI
jgi:hypothetical protein